MKRVWSIIINDYFDCVILDDAEAMLVKMKFMPNIKMFDLTTLHNLEPEHLHMMQRKEVLDNDVHIQWIKNALETGVFGGWPGKSVYDTKEHKEFADLLDMPAPPNKQTQVLTT
tara:strand:+ start:488 stop:829 length:342 start_codon:yes stop_codon:yes gene_type:complete